MTARAAPLSLIARLGGLPCHVIAEFSTRLGERLDASSRLDTALKVARGELVDRLYEGIHGASPDKRRALLAVKRDCFNDRPLHQHRTTAAWQFVEETAGSLAARVMELEHQAGVAQLSFIAAHEEEASRQHQYLAALLDDPVLRCGLAIGSPVVAREAARLRENPPERYGRRERRLASTLLRYISRATLKLSPFSTFTPVGLAQIGDGDAPLAFVGSGWRRHSLVRLRRYILDRCSDLLLGYLPWRNRHEVAINDSTVTLVDGRVLYRRSSHYRIDEQANKVQYHEESLVRVGLRGPLVERATALLADGSLPYREVVDLLAVELAGDMPETAVTEQVDRLIDIGYLHLIAPWASDEGHLEKTMLRELRQLPSDAALETLLGNLELLVKLEEGFLDSNDPAASLQQMQALINRLIRGAADLGSVPAGVDVTKPSAHDIYQDVWCAPEAGGSEAIVHAGRTSLDEALRSVEPLVRYARLWDHRLEFLRCLGELLRDRKGQDCGISLLEAFETAQPLWRDFMKFQMQSRGGQQWRATWNPLGLTVLNGLASWRDAAYRGMISCLTKSPEGQTISIEALDALLAPIPKRFTDSHGGACLFLQPATADGSLWMLNRMKEGTGRFASRYTPLMPAALRERYGAELSRRGMVEIDGEEVQFLDIHCVQGDTLNVHAPQTPKILVLPGLRLDLPAERVRSLGDLVVTVDAEGWPQLRDRDGQRYLPVYLGGGYHDYLPTLVKFLCAFGPSEMGAVFPPVLSREVGDMAVQERTVIGNVVLHRKSWHVRAEELRRILDGPSEAEVFTALHRWRRGREIPDRVFAIERVPHPVDDTRFHYQPQYLDLTSPLFIAILRSIAVSCESSIMLVEMLPSPDAFPRDTEGRAWAIELLVDSLSLRPIEPCPKPPVREDETFLHRMSRATSVSNAARGSRVAETGPAVLQFSGRVYSTNQEALSLPGPRKKELR